MYFSEAYDIADPAQYEWFDPILEQDTRLFVDPFLIFKDEDPYWSAAHNRVTEYFQTAFEMLARSDLNKNHQYYRRVVQLMRFPEPKELRLGYTSKSNSGSGSGIGLANKVVEAMASAITRGLRDVRHFEELGILVPRFNRDRISDVICNLLKPELIEYTQQVCQQLEIPTVLTRVAHSSFDEMRNRWVSELTELPVDPMLRQPLILLPKRFLRELPTLDPDNWYRSLDDSLREDLNLRISQHLRKEDILNAAVANIGLFREWIEREEQRPANPYDVDVDPMLYVLWQRLAKDVAARWPNMGARYISTEADMVSFVREIIGYVRHWVEEEGGWRLFWHSPAKSIPETNMQILFLGMVRVYCENAGVRIDREVETGRGPVDFTFTGDKRLRILVEMKKLNHGKFWHGLTDQTPTYMHAQQVERGLFLAIRNATTPAMNDRWADLDAIAAEASRKTGFLIEAERIDAMPKASASLASYALSDPTGESDDDEPEDEDDREDE